VCGGGERFIPRESCEPLLEESRAQALGPELSFACCVTSNKPPSRSGAQFFSSENGIIIRIIVRIKWVNECKSTLSVGGAHRRHQHLLIQNNGGLQTLLVEHFYPIKIF
jgi:hypothetical protein